MMMMMMMIVDDTGSIPERDGDKTYNTCVALGPGQYYHSSPCQSWGNSHGWMTLRARQHA